MKPEELDQFEGVRVWLNAIYAHATGSSRTQRQYRRFLNYFLDFASRSPDDSIKTARDFRALSKY